MHIPLYARLGLDCSLTIFLFVGTSLKAIVLPEGNYFSITFLSARKYFIDFRVGYPFKG